MTAELPQKRSKFRWWLMLSVMGPGLVVMLADTDAGSIITAAQSGATWGYKLLVLQFILMPILYIAQELTVRLGIVTGKGHGELIKDRFGTGWAWLSVSTLVICCIGAIISEFSGLAGIGMMFGISPKVSMSIIVLFLAVIAWTGSYKSVERIAICIGLFELVFLYVAWHAHPPLKAILHDVKNAPFTDPTYLYLMAANIGAVIMPWMIFYQQSAVIDKGLGRKHLKYARIDTAIGAVITQLVMASVLIATAAAIGEVGAHHAGTALNTVEEISQALAPLGATTSRILFAMGMLGAALVAAIVVSLTAAWGLGEVLGYKRSLQDHPKEAPWFYIVYTIVLVFGGLFVIFGASHLVAISVAVEVMNALLLPLVLGFLFLLAWKALPEAYKLKGFYWWFVAIILGITSLFGLMAGIYGS